MRAQRVALVHRNTEHQDKEMLEQSSPHRFGGSSRTQTRIKLTARNKKRKGSIGR